MGKQNLKLIWIMNDRAELGEARLNQAFLYPYSENGQLILMEQALQLHFYNKTT